MADYKLILPSMGEGVMEATVTNWLKNIGDTIAEDESVVEIATDKVDSDLPSPVSGTLKEILVQVDEVAKVGEPVAILEVDGEVEQEEVVQASETIEKDIDQLKQSVTTSQENPVQEVVSSADRFYSPLVKSIAKEEGISQTELDQIHGTGLEGRVTKDDLKKYLETRGQQPKIESTTQAATSQQSISPATAPVMTVSGEDEIIEMDRMRKIIAQNMVQAKQIAPHVTSFIEADLTNIVLWREKNKKAFEAKYGEKITYMPIFIQAITKAILDFPMINVSVDGERIIKKKNINIGMAAALPSGNLIVPVIKNADQYSLSLSLIHI